MKKDKDEFKKILDSIVDEDLPSPQELETTKIETPKLSGVSESAEDYVSNREKIERLMADSRMRQDLLEAARKRKDIPGTYHKKHIKENLKKIRELLKSPAGKTGAKLLAGVGIIGKAVEALAGAEDIAEEEQLLKEREKERMFESLPEEVKKESKKLSSKKIKPEDLLQKELQDTTKPMIKAVGGEEDIRPSVAEKMLGEKESEDVGDIPEFINYEDYLKRKKKLFGYE